MPTRRGVRVALLVEDEALDRFAYCVLLVLGFHRREIRVERSPKGQGSAKQWVSRRFPNEVQAQRRKANSQNVALVVGTDADEIEVIERARELDSSLDNAGLDPRESKE